MGAQQQPIVGPETTMGEVMETFLTDVATRARQVVASTQTHALDSAVKELEHVVSFIRVVYPAAFSVCLEECG